MLSMNIDRINRFRFSITWCYCPISGVCWLFLKVFVARAVHPYDACHGDQCHRRKDHETVVLISVFIGPLRNHLETKERSATEQLAEESYDNQDYTITEAVAYAVEERSPRTVGAGERLRHEYPLFRTDRRT